VENAAQLQVCGSYAPLPPDGVLLSTVDILTHPPPPSPQVVYTIPTPYRACNENTYGIYLFFFFFFYNKTIKPTASFSTAPTLLAMQLSSDPSPQLASVTTSLHPSHL
jgi:hypothetical protein